MNKINSWDEFQPLEELVVGSCYDSNFFDAVKNIRAKDALKKIIDDTNEDLENFENTMKSHNIKVYKPDVKKLGYKDSILDYVNVNGELGYRKNVGDEEAKNDDNFWSTGVSPSLVPNPPLQPRDDCIVMGNKLLATDPWTFATKKLLPQYEEWFGKENIDCDIKDGKFKFERSNRSLKNFLGKNNIEVTPSNIAKYKKDEGFMLSSFCSPNLTRIGKTCLVDTWQVPTVVEDFLETQYPEFKYKKLSIGGHNDSVFSVIRPGVVVASRDLEPFKDLFKGWEIIWFEDPNWSKVQHWKDLKHKNQGKWWVPEEENNDEFTAFVESFLHDWTGYVEETIFDVNCLVLDERHVVVNTENPHLIENLRKYQIEPVVCPLRHRFFWDGGWHCLTLDIKRKGKQVDYGI